MNKEQDYASDTDESDEDFRPDNLAGESAASEDEEADDSEGIEEGTEGAKDAKNKLRKRRKATKKSDKKKRSKSKDEDETDEDVLDNGKEDLQTGRRTTRQSEDLITNGKGKTFERDELESDDEDKSRTNALWADFLNDVKPEAATVAKPNLVKTNEKPSSSSSSNGKEQTDKTRVVKQETKAQLTKSAKEGLKKTVVTEVVDFAGEEVRIQREIDSSSIKENKAAATPAPKLQPFGRIMPGAGGLKRLAPSSGAAGSSAGLGSFLNQLGKKKKISVLEKSQMDWKSFKQDEGIDEQLQTFNKGKDGYLERQDFLQRTDLRQFEIEKSLRQSTRRPH